MVGGSWKTGILKAKWPRIAPVETSLSMIVCLIGKERHLDAEHERGRAGGYGQEGGRWQWEGGVSAGAEQSPKRRRGSKDELSRLTLGFHECYFCCDWFLILFEANSLQSVEF